MNTDSADEYVEQTMEYYYYSDDEDFFTRSQFIISDYQNELMQFAQDQYDGTDDDDDDIDDDNELFEDSSNKIRPSFQQNQTKSDIPSVPFDPPVLFDSFDEMVEILRQKEEDEMIDEIPVE